MNYQIYTMYVNNKDLLIQAIESVDRHAGKVVVIDNSPEQDLEIEDFPGEIYKPTVPLFCNQSYNLIVKLAKERGQPVLFMMHSDAGATNEVVETLLAHAETLNGAGRRWGVLMTNYDVLCLLNTEVVKDFPWDRYLPHSYTDVDFYYRLLLAGVEIIETGLHVEHRNGGSSTMQADPMLNQFIQSNYHGWRDYYMRKWGGERSQEVYRTPFNQ